MKVYISGKISGLDIDVARNNFKEAEQMLLMNGHDPVNPFDLSETDSSKTWQDYMKDDIRGLLECDAIYLMPNWRQSKGARLECVIASNLGLRIFKQCDFNN